MNLLKEVCTQLLIAGIICYSAIYISKFVKTKARLKPNSCLPYWHVVNLLILILLTAVQVILKYRETQADNKCER